MGDLEDFLGLKVAISSSNFCSSSFFDELFNEEFDISGGLKFTLAGDCI